MECTRPNDNRQPCNDVLSLFCTLRIPRREQHLLWEMTRVEMGCSGLKNILYLMQTKKQRRAGRQVKK
jgi:hypothetical protein